MPLLAGVIRREGSDLFITAGWMPAMKVAGDLQVVFNQVLTPEDSARLLPAVMTKRQADELAEK